MSPRLLWRGCSWQPFLAPSKGGFAVARIAPQSYSCTDMLPDVPGAEQPYQWLFIQALGVSDCMRCKLVKSTEQAASNRSTVLSFDEQLQEMHSYSKYGAGVYEMALVKGTNSKR